jgi:hypothetical protein
MGRLLLFMVNDAQIVFRDFRSERLQAPNGAVLPRALRFLKKDRKINKIGLTIQGVVLLSPPACRKRECRKEKKLRVKR